MKQNILEVVYAANDSYARHLGVSLCSLLDRNQDMEGIRVHILSRGISRENKERLKEIGEQYGRKIVFAEIENLEDKFEHPVDTGGYDISILLRLFMAEVLPPDLNRVLYLDCDTVIVQSLKKLWTVDLRDCIAGAVMEPTIYKEVKDSIGLGEKDPYFNSGVLLIDLKKWREEEIQKKLLAFWKKKGGKLFASDQDVINGTLKGRILSLPPRYNFFTNYRYFSYRALVRASHTYRSVTPAELRDAKRHPFVIHYMGDERPWIAWNLNHYRRAYEIYLAKTPWAGTPKEKGKRLYMLAYHGLDYVTALFPAVRFAISRNMGMKFVENRKKDRKN